MDSPSGVDRSFDDTPPPTTTTTASSSPTTGSGGGLPVARGDSDSDDDDEDVDTDSEAIAAALDKLERVARAERQFAHVPAARAAVRGSPSLGGDVFTQCVLALSEDGVDREMHALVAESCVGSSVGYMLQMVESYAIVQAELSAAEAALVHAVRPFEPTTEREALVRAAEARLRTIAVTSFHSTDEVFQALEDTAAAMGHIPRTSQLADCAEARTAFERFAVLATAKQHAGMIVKQMLEALAARLEFLYGFLASPAEVCCASVVLEFGTQLMRSLLLAGADAVDNNRRMLLPCAAMIAKRACTGCGRVLLLSKSKRCQHHSDQQCLRCLLVNTKEPADIAAVFQVATTDVDTAWRDFVMHRTNNKREPVVAMLVPPVPVVDTGHSSYCNICFGLHST